MVDLSAYPVKRYISTVSCDTARHTAIIDAPGRGFALRNAAGATEWSGTIGADKTCQNTAVWPFAIFAATINAAGQADQWVSMRVYGVKIYENNVLVRDFQPAQKHGALGFHDAVTGEFRYGNGQLQSGGTLPEIEDDATPYLASNGSQFLPLGYYMNPKSRIEVDFRCPTPVTSGLYFGAWRSGVRLATGFWVSGNRYSFLLNDNELKNYQSSCAADAVRHTAVIDVRNRRMELRNANGTPEWSSQIASGCTCANTAAWPVAIFGATYEAAGAADQLMSMRLYGVKIYEDETLIHDYVPCLKGPSSVLRDRITGAIRSPSRSLATGGDIASVADDPCLESTGNQAISTGYRMNPRTRLEVDYAYTKFLPAKMAFGAWNTSGGAGQATGLWLNNATNLEYIAGDSFKSHYPPSANTSPDTVRHTAIFDYKGGRLLHVSGICTNWTKTGLSFTTTANWPLGLFAGCSNADGTAFDGLNASIRLYGVKIFEDDVLVKNLVPQIAADGSPVLRDTVTATTLTNGTLSSPLPGGTLEADPDAYVQSDPAATTVLNTGYHLNTRSRVEVDFHIYDGTGSSIIFGAWDGGASLRYCFWHNGTTWQCIFGAQNNSPQYVTDRTVDAARHTAVLDIYGRRLSYVTGGVTNYTHALDNEKSAFVEGETCRDPMGIFGGLHQGLAADMPQKSMRVYSVRIYEANELIHELLPCRQGETVGLYDVCTGTLVQRSLATMSQPTIGGCGCEGSGASFRLLPGPVTLAPEQSQTLTVFAPGAIRYVWTRNGEVLSETGNRVTATWRKGGETDVYTVSGVYLVDGAEKVGAASTIRVTHVLRGLMILVR